LEKLHSFLRGQQEHNPPSLPDGLGRRRVSPEIQAFNGKEIRRKTAVNFLERREKKKQALREEISGGRFDTTVFNGRKRTSVLDDQPEAHPPDPRIDSQAADGTAISQQ
jgi:hypothetical protein